MIQNKINLQSLLFLLILGFTSCEYNLEPSEERDPNIRRYLMLGHTYDWIGEGIKIDSRLEKLDYTGYDGIWLGGDICSETSRNFSTLEYLDNIFNISDLSTKWAMGNHDIRNGNLDWISAMTQRELYHVDHFDGITFLTINTQIEHPTLIDNCEMKAMQTSFINSVLDTVVSADYLIIFSHNSVWSDLEPSVDAQGQIGNQTAHWMDFDCDRPSVFRTEFGPRVLEIQEAGTQVILVGGDGGQYQKSFMHIGDTGIWYYMSGINNSVIKTGDQERIATFDTRPDSVLIFEHNLEMRSLTGRFIPVDEI